MTGQPDLDLWPTDVVSLGRGVSLQGQSLVDQLTGKIIKINGSAALLLASVDGRTSVEHCALFVAAEHGWDPQEVTNDFAGVLDILDKSALIEIRRSLTSRVKPQNLIAEIGRIVSLNWPRPGVRRYPPTAWALSVACLRAARWGLLGALVVSSLIATILTAQGLGGTVNSWKLLYAFIPVFLYAALVGHVIFHEAGHLVAMNALAPQHCKYVLVRGIRVSVAHAGLKQESKRAVAMAGPLAGFIGAQVIGLAVLPIPVLGEVAPVIALSGLLHLYSLSPWTADGRMIWKKRT